jgi:23S rRNA (cytidine1920-2'-O)/16S rRNA (cytidine1409-2'-O)-methyltransferase
MKKRTRLDHVLAELYPHFSKTFIQSLIMQGKVRIDGEPLTKPGTLITSTEGIRVDAEVPRYVSRAGFKLEHALSFFSIDVDGAIALDAGLSTGGFTDCLLQHGAQKIYGVDVGYGQVHEKIRNDARVVTMERTNLRHVETLPEHVDIVTLDLSFISLLKVIPVIKRLIKPQGKLITLIKPQFEAHKHEIGKGGIVKDPAVHQAVIEKVIAGIQAEGFLLQGYTASSILGTDGNKEFLAYFVYLV